MSTGPLARGEEQVTVIRANGTEEYFAVPVELVESEEGAFRATVAGKEKRVVPSYDFNAIPNLKDGDRIEIENGVTIRVSELGDD